MHELECAVTTAVPEVTTANVMVVEDEPHVRDTLVSYLERDGYSVRSAGDGKQALAMLASQRADLLLLDLMLPQMDGLTVLKKLRESGDRVPVIVLSAKGAESERVTGLELGADDYIAKPASPREVLARVRAVLRRSGPIGPDQITFGDFEIDVTGRRLTRSGTEVDLPPREFDLLVQMASSPGAVFSRSDLLREVWGSNPEWQDPGTVTVHMRRLRRKIEADPANPAHLMTVYGVGYRFDP